LALDDVCNGRKLPQTDSAPGDDRPPNSNSDIFCGPGTVVGLLCDSVCVRVSDLVVTITTTITKSNCSSLTKTVTITKSKSNIKTILKLNQNTENYI